MSTSRATGRRSPAPSGSPAPCLSVSSTPQRSSTPARSARSSAPRAPPRSSPRPAVGDHRRGAYQAHPGSTAARAGLESATRSRPASASHDERLEVALGPGQSRAREAAARGSEPRPRPSADRRPAPAAQRRIADDAALADAPPPDLELRLDQRQASKGGAAREHRRRAPCASEMKETSITARSGAYGSVDGLQRPRVAALDHGHARVRPHPPVELAVGDVERDHVRRRRAASRQSVKPPVEAPTSRQRRPAPSSAERVKRVGELDPAA